MGAQDILVYVKESMGLSSDAAVESTDAAVLVIYFYQYLPL